MRSNRNLIFGSTALLLGACGTAPEAHDELTAWLGETDHLRVVGQLGVEHVDIDVAGEAASMAIGCERDYEVPMVGGQPAWGAGSLTDFDVNGHVTIAGESRAFSIEFKQHDFQSDPPGTRLQIVPRDDENDPAVDEMWFEWEWHDENDEETFERSAEQGTFVLEAFGGQPGSNGLVIPEGEGWVGGFVNARWSETEEIRLSFSARCGANEVVTFE